MIDSPSFSESLKHGWNAFRNKDPAGDVTSTWNHISVSSTSRPDRRQLSFAADATFINSIINRIAVDVSSCKFGHVKVDENGGYLSTVNSGLNDIFNTEANIDQSANAFIIDLVISLLDEGCVACVPVDTVVDPRNFPIGTRDILTMRTGKIVNWYPDRVSVELFNEDTGNKQIVTLPKSMVAIIENPFYNIMNGRNSTLKRLTRRMALLDIADEKVTSPRLDMLVQLPYSVRNAVKESQAKKRQEEIVSQLEQSEYGIAYIDGTEKVIQLNRPVENTLMPQIELLTTMLFNQLGLTPEIMNGTASEQAMTNYNVRIVNPICDAIILEFSRKFITKTARTQGQTIWYHRPPFMFTTTSTLADVADKFTRNEILSPNEIRQPIGYKPAQDKGADELRNRNISPTAFNGVVGYDSSFPQEDVSGDSVTPSLSDVINGLSSS